jgi:hypothetical protein
VIKGTLHQEDITIVNKYALNINALNFIKETLLDIKALTDPNAIIVYDLIPHLTNR